MKNVTPSGKQKIISISIPIHIWENLQSMPFGRRINVSGICSLAIEKAITEIKKSDLKL